MTSSSPSNLSETALKTMYRDYFTAKTTDHGTIVSKGLDLTVQIHKNKVVSTARLNHRLSTECRQWTVSFEGETPSFQGGATSFGATISHLDYVAKAVARHKHLGFALPMPSSAFPWQIITMSKFVDSPDTAGSVNEQDEVVSAALRFLDPRMDGLSQPAADEASGGESLD